MSLVRGNSVSVTHKKQLSSRRMPGISRVAHMNAQVSSQPEPVVGIKKIYDGIKSLYCVGMRNTHRFIVLLSHARTCVWQHCLFCKLKLKRSNLMLMNFLFFLKKQQIILAIVLIVVLVCFGVQYYFPGIQQTKQSNAQLVVRKGGGP